MKTGFRHYVGLARTERRLRRLLQVMPFDRMDRVIASVLASDGVSQNSLAVC